MDLNAEEPEEVEEGAPAWMATFSDMATLLLTFFVLLLSFANMDVENFRVALGSVKEAFGVQLNVKGDYEGLTTSPVELSNEQSLPRIEVSKVDMKEDLLAVMKHVESKGMKDKIEVHATSRGIVLRIKDVVLFDVGSADLKESSLEILDTVDELFERYDGEMTVEGHTDDRPINSTRFPSNWELSTSRAIAVMRYVVADDDKARKRVRVAGYADTRPLADNASAEGRAKNRRVEFLFETASGGSVGGGGSRQRVFRLPFYTTTVP